MSKKSDIEMANRTLNTYLHSLSIDDGSLDGLGTDLSNLHSSWNSPAAQDSIGKIKNRIDALQDIAHNVQGIYNSLKGLQTSLDIVEHIQKDTKDII